MKNVFTFLLLLFSLLCNGQSPKLFTTDKELSSSLINQIYQDRNGFIWIATEDGLNRYDGAKFTIYKHEPNNEHSLAHNFVRTVFEDSKGHLFIGTYMGIQMYDPATDNFTPLAIREDNGEIFESNIVSFIERRNGEIWVSGNMLCRLKYVSAGADMLDQYNFTSDALQETGAVGYIWRKIYEALANVNNVIQYQPQVISAYPNAKDMCQRILGEALFLRALCHFDLCRVYAQPYNYTSDASHLGVPILLKTPGPDDNVSRESVKKVYLQILADLERAADCFRGIESSGIYYASLQAVNALYSRVYLYMEDWNNALKYAKLAIGTGKLSQGDTYLNMYQDLSTTGEAIFRLNGIDQSGKLKAFYDASCVPADTLFTLFDEGDIRLGLLRNKDGIAYCSKYYSLKQPDNQVNRDDPFVFRLSEMYMNAAEAAWHLKDYTAASGYLKSILERAVDTDYAVNTLSQYSDAKLIQLIEKERVKELCFEGHNFFDIIRWKQDLKREENTNSSVEKIVYPSDYFVLPIPQVELNANTNMQPNPTVNN